MNMSTEIDKIAPELVAIQSAMTVVRDAKGVHNAKYATLGAILATIRPALEAHGLTVIQTMDTSGTEVKCTTRIMHVSGQFIDSSIAVTAAGLSPQQYGSAISYARRYSVTAALSISTPDDDDDADKMERAYTKAEEKEAQAVELRKFQAAILKRLMKYDSEPLQMAFEESGYASDEEDKEKMLCDLIKQSNSKAKLTTIGKRCKVLQDEVEASVKTPLEEMEL